MVWNRSDSVSRLQGRDVEGVRGGWVRPNWVKLEPNQDGQEAAVSKSFSEVQRLSWTVGKLEALKDFYSKLERQGIGTTRTELKAQDLIFQNVLRSLDN